MDNSPVSEEMFNILLNTSPMAGLLTDNATIHNMLHTYQLHVETALCWEHAQPRRCSVHASQAWRRCHC